jgi:GR25 family glycosyltransferase involved in LPS biosynthesis
MPEGRRRMDIALINLDRTPDRLAEFVRVNRHLQTVKRYAAVDGRTLDTNALIADGLIEPAILAAYTKGALGNACSHLGLWGIAVQESRAVTVCEDDAILNRHFAEAADRLMAALPADWDIVLWGWNFDSYLLFDMLPGVSTCLAAFDQAAMRAGVEHFQAQAVSPRLFRLQRAFGCPCYSISAKGAALFRSHCIPLREMPVFFPGLNRHRPNDGIDIPMNDAYPQLQAYVSFPPLAITPNRHDISTSRRND